MFRRNDDNIHNAGRGQKTGRAIVYIVCIFVILLCILLDVYFILGIVG